MEPLDDKTLDEILSQLRLDDEALDDKALDDEALDDLLSQLRLDDKALDELLLQLGPESLPEDPSMKYLDVPKQDDHTDETNDAGEAHDGAWTRSDDETAKAYAAFCAYRDLGSSRSLDAAFAQAKGCQKGVRFLAAMVPR